MLEMHFRFCNNNNNNPPARITAREATEQKLNILLEWPYGTPVLSASHRLSHANCTAGRKLETEVGVNIASCLVALIATETVSSALRPDSRKCHIILAEF